MSANLAPEAVGADQAHTRLNIQGQIIEAHSFNGKTWIREDQLAFALGFHFVSTFSHTMASAGLYRGAVRTGKIQTAKGQLDVKLYSLNGGMQACLFLQAHRDGDKASRARELLNLLQMLRSPRYEWEGA